MENDFRTLVALLPGLVADRVITPNDRPFVVLESMCASLGTDWPTALQALKAAPDRWHLVELNTDPRGDGHVVRALCLSLAEVPDWIATLDAAAVRPDLWDWLDIFQSGQGKEPHTDCDPDRDLRRVDLPEPGSGETPMDVLYGWISDHHEVIGVMREQQSQLARRVDTLERLLEAAVGPRGAAKRKGKGRSAEPVQ